MKKIWITGAEGHIGTALIDLLEGVEYQLLPTDINEVDITKIDEVTQFVHVNAIGVRNVALAANEVNAKVIQISTDDVFDKESRIPYNEFDNVHPRTIYGKSKEAGEKILTQLLNRFVIIRSSWIYGIGRDFVDEDDGSAEQSVCGADQRERTGEGNPLFYRQRRIRSLPCGLPGKLQQI